MTADGSLTNNRIFAEMHSAEPGVPDGMKVDTLGRVFCTGSGGIWVFDAEGTHLGIIRGPEIPRNLAFGGGVARKYHMVGRGPFLGYNNQDESKAESFELILKNGWK